MDAPKWRPIRDLGLEPEPVYPELETDPPLDEDYLPVSEEYHGGTSIVAGQYQGPRVPRRGTPPMTRKPKVAWAGRGGELERVLVDALGLPASYRQVIADSLRAAATGARIVDRRCGAICGDVIREWFTGRD